MFFYAYSLPNERVADIVLVRVQTLCKFILTKPQNLERTLIRENGLYDHTTGVSPSGESYT